MSSKRKTNYNKSWGGGGRGGGGLGAEFAWVQPNKTDEFSALCRICSKVLSISGVGIAQVKIQATYIKGEGKRKGQSMFKKNGDNALSLKGTQITLAKGDMIRKTEIIRALKCVESNHLFLSSTADSKIFKEMFPDLQIAKTRMKCTIQYCIYP